MLRFAAGRTQTERARGAGRDDRILRHAIELRTDLGETILVLFGVQPDASVRCLVNEAVEFERR